MDPAGFTFADFAFPVAPDELTGFTADGFAWVDVAPTETPVAPGGTFRRPLWSWARTFARPLWSWGRTWRYAVSNSLPPVTLTKPEEEDRDFVLDFSKAPELVGGTGITLASAEVIDADAGISFGTPTLLPQSADGVPAGKGFSLEVYGGTRDAAYLFAVKATLSNARTLVLPCRVAVTANTG